LRAREPAVAQRRRERDLDIDLDVGGVDAGRIVDGIGVEPQPAQRRLDAAALRHAEIGALSDHPALQLGPADADRVIGAIADGIIGLGRGPHIGADAAEPEQVDRHFENGLHHLLRIGLVGLQPQRASAPPATALFPWPRVENTPPPFEMMDLS